MAAKMKAAVLVEPGRIVLDEKPVPDIGPLDALIQIITTTICGTDVHILKGEYPMKPRLTIGHEPVGVIEKLGAASSPVSINETDRVISAKESFWSIVTMRNDDETEADDARQLGGRVDQGYPTRPTEEIPAQGASSVRSRRIIGVMIEL